MRSPAGTLYAGPRNPAEGILADRLNGATTKRSQVGSRSKALNVAYACNNSTGFSVWLTMKRLITGYELERQ
jgi:hypothetical protein